MFLSRIGDGMDDPRHFGGFLFVPDGARANDEYRLMLGVLILTVFFSAQFSFGFQVSGISGCW